MQRPIVRRASHELSGNSLHPILARVYAGRGVRDVSELDHSLRHLLAPDSLSGIDAAAELLGASVQRGRRILIIGDFDADGATSSALMVRTLRAFGARYVDYLVPNRFEFGYGLTPEIVRVAQTRDPQLIVTVDNGTASVDGVAQAREAGIDVMITDHHLPGERLPDANVVVNPNLAGDQFPSKNLAGVGVAFYVLAATRRWLRERGWFDARAQPSLAQFLDLVALGTIADVVPLDANNRVLVAQGLQRIRDGACCAGITELLSVAGSATQPVTAMDLAFLVAPRLNAAGRLVDMSVGIECLLCDDPTTARELARELHELNRQRREIEAQMREQGEAALADTRLSDARPMAMSFYHPDWHQGVIGILAARLRERTDRPVVVFADDGDTDLLKGSARSLPGVHIRDAIERVATRNPGLVLRFGGHAAAAGLSIQRSRFDEFRASLAYEVDALLEGIAPHSEVLSDGDIPAAQLNLELAELLREAGVWGQGFQEPLFDGEFEVVTSRVVGGKHVKMVLKPCDGARHVDAIQFGSDVPPQPVDRLRIAYRLEVNEYDGLRRAQLNVVHRAEVDSRSA
ncbi:MAG: single-stranded-DNA-specific exonuclease RecJ [Gammaproteobacteria bacterium]|nr:single-stranded-DNA-specific exonuclease RecJ [Gammaproteobacteria bacterium]